MEIITSDNHCIITPLAPKLDLGEVSRLKNEIDMLSDRVIGLNMQYVKDCTIEFFDEIKQIKNLCIFNLSSDIFALINFMNIDKGLNIYVSELDFRENKRQLLNRRLKVLQ